MVIPNSYNNTPSYSIARSPIPCISGMRIMMISDDFLPAATGVGIHIQSMAEHLVRMGFRVSVVTTRRRGEPEYDVWKGVEIFRMVSIKVAGFYQAVPRRTTLRRILTTQNPDIIHYHYLSLLMLRTHAMTSTWRVKQVYTYHMTVDHLTAPFFMKPFRSSLARTIKNFCNDVDLVLAPSRQLAAQIIDSGISTPTHFLSNAIYFSNPKRNSNLLKNNPFVIFYAGRLAPEKNLPLLLRAFALHSKCHPSSALWIAGTGSQEKALVRLCQRLNITQKVRFLGFVNHDELVQCYADADVFVLPSTIETQGLVALEAMLHHTPVIVTNRIVSCNELVEEGRNGFIVDADAPDQLADRINLLCRNPALRQKMARHASHKARLFEPEPLSEKLVAHYYRLRGAGTYLHKKEVRIRLNDRPPCPAGLSAEV